MSRRPLAHAREPQAKAPDVQPGLVRGPLQDAPRQRLQAEQVSQLFGPGRAPVQRFSVPGAFSFADQKRAKLPVSLSTSIATGLERHHIVGDRSILKYLQKLKDEAAKGLDPAAPVPIEANAWGKAALDQEVQRLTEAVQKYEAIENPYDEDTKRLKHLKAALPPAQTLAGKMDKASADEPALSSEEIAEELLPVLEWMPSNLVISIEARSSDPGDALDIEAMALHADKATGRLLAKIAIGMGEIDEGTLTKLDADLKGHKNEAKWKQLVEEAKASKPTELLATLVNSPKGGEGQKMAPSTAPKKTKQKLKADQWYALLLKVIQGPA